MMRYELLYILPPTLTDEEATKEAAKVSELIKAEGAEISQEVDLGKKRLAYPIQRQRYGYYRLVEFNAESPVLTKLNKILRLERDLLRHLVVEKPMKSKGQIEREQELRDRLAAKRKAAEAITEEAVRSAHVEKAPTISEKELDEKLSQILEEGPEV